MAEDLPFDLAQLGTRVQTELVCEQAAEVLVDSECVRLPSRPVQRDHQLGAQAFLERVLIDERGQLGQYHCMPAERCLCLDLFLECAQPQLFEPGDFSLRERFALEVGKRRAVP